MLVREEIYRKMYGLDKLSVATSEGYTLIDYNSILYLKAYNNYTIFSLTDKTKLIASKNLGYFERKFLNKPFIRIHHSYIVNATKITKYLKAEERIVITNEESIPVSRKRKDALLRLFK